MNNVESMYAFEEYRHGIYRVVCDSEGNLEVVCHANQKTIPAGITPRQNAHIEKSHIPGYRYFIKCIIKATYQKASSSRKCWRCGDLGCLACEFN